MLFTHEWLSSQSFENFCAGGTFLWSRHGIEYLFVSSKVVLRKLSAPCRHLGAENGTRTRDLLLGKETLYQLSYFRDALIVT